MFSVTWVGTVAERSHSRGRPGFDSWSTQHSNGIETTTPSMPIAQESFHCVTLTSYNAELTDLLEVSRSVGLAFFCSCATVRLLHGHNATKTDSNIPASWVRALLARPRLLSWTTTATGGSASSSVYLLSPPSALSTTTSVPAALTRLIEEAALPIWPWCGVDQMPGGLARALHLVDKLNAEAFQVIDYGTSVDQLTTVGNSINCGYA